MPASLSSLFFSTSLFRFSFKFQRSLFSFTSFSTTLSHSKINPPPPPSSSLSLYFLSITSCKRWIHWLLFLFIDASRSLFLLSGSPLYFFYLFETWYYDCDFVWKCWFSSGQFAIFKGILGNSIYNRVECGYC